MSQEAIRKALEDVLEEMGVSDAAVHLEQPKDPSHGDLATNVALTLASTLGKPPRAIAEEIASRMELGVAGIQAVEVAGPLVAELASHILEPREEATGIPEDADDRRHAQRDLAAPRRYPFERAPFLAPVAARKEFDLQAPDFGILSEHARMVRTSPVCVQPSARPPHRPEDSHGFTECLPIAGVESP